MKTNLNIIADVLEEAPVLNGKVRYCRINIGEEVLKKVVEALRTHPNAMEEFETVSL